MVRFGMEFDSAYERLVDDIYLAATGDLPWARVLAQLTAATGGIFAYIQEHDAETGAVVRLLHDCAPLESIPEYVDHWSKYDPRLAYALRHPRKALYTDYAILGDDAAISANMFYNEYLAPLDVRYMVASSLAMPDGPDGGSRIGYVGVNRTAQAGHVGRTQSDLIVSLRPHLVRAFAIESKFRVAARHGETVGDALNGLSYGVVIVDGAATVRWTNEAARAILSSSRSIALKRGVLEASKPAERDTLRNLIASACRSVDGQDASPGGALFVGGGTPGPVEVMVAPLPRRSERLRGAGLGGNAVVFLSRPAAHRVTEPGALAALYGLTPVETRLAVALANGLTLKQVAEELETTHETVRTYIKRVYSKTGARTQAQLVRIVLNGPAALLNSK